MRPTSIVGNLVVLCLLVVGCGGRLRPEPLPYRFADPLLGGDDAQLRQRASSSAQRPPDRAPAARQADAQASWRLAVARRCRELIGQTLAGGDQALLEAALADRWRATALSSMRWRRHPPRPGDLVLFGTGSQQKVGIVIRRAGPRVSFVHVLDQRVRRGWLHLQQPNRRRLPGQDAVVNSYVRPKLPDDPPGTRYLSGQLLRGFASLV